MAARDRLLKAQILMPNALFAIATITFAIHSPLTKGGWGGDLATPPIAQASPQAAEQNNSEAIAQLKALETTVDLLTKLLYAVAALAITLPIGMVVIMKLGRDRWVQQTTDAVVDSLEQELRSRLDADVAKYRTEATQQFRQQQQTISQGLYSEVRQELDRLKDAVTVQAMQGQSNDSDPQLWYARGNALDELGRYDEAIAAYDRALEADPKFYAAWVNRGYCLDRLGRYRGAITAFDQALRLKPDYDGLWYNRGTVLGKIQRYGAAVESFNRALKLKPNFPAAWNNRGTALTKLNHYDEAIASFDRAISLAEDTPGPWYGKACCFAAQNKVELAIEHLHRAIQIDPTTYRELAKTDPEFNGVRSHDLFAWLLSEEDG
ncbi:MAG: tetratricopeptide repeat protein [Cyanobacteria bacterium P01_F01_bin.153]